MKKKIIAVLLSACMLVSACPTGAFAMSDEETNTYTATGDVMQGETSVVDETPAPEETAAPEETPTPAPEETPTPAPAETPAPVEVKAQATPAAGAEEAAPAKQSEETGIAMTMLRPDDEKPKVDTYRFYNGDTELTEWRQTVAAGEVLLEPTAPTKDNARFVGWYVGETPLNFGTVETVSGTEVTVTAKFEEFSYVYFLDEDGDTVVYHTAAGTAGETVGEDVLNAATAKVELTMSKDKGVVGWSTTQGSDTPETITFAAGVKYVYPVVRNGFWVTFDTNGGDYVAPRFLMEALDLNTVKPTRSGYKFDGWYGADGNPVTTVSETATVTAHWKANSKTEYTVIHWQENANDNEYSSKDIEKKTGATNSTTNARAKSYSGFTAQAITQKTIAGDGSTIVNIYYKRDVYDVKFYSYSSWVSSSKEYTNLRITAKYGANISDKWPTYNGSSTWSTSDGGSTYQVNIDTMPLKGATFYGPKTGDGSETAYYYVEVLPGESGTTTYNGVQYKLHHSDTSPGSGFTVSDEDKYPITGFKFKEFKADYEWVGGIFSGEYKPKYDNAEFYYTRNSYEITFINRGTKEKTESRKYQQDISDVTYTPTRPAGVPANFTFAGWYDNEYCGGTAYDFTGKTMPAQNITLYAKWQAPVIEAKVYLTASADGEFETIEIPYGTKLSDSEKFKALLEKLEEKPSAWIDSNGALFNVDTKLHGSVTISPFFPSAKDGFTVTYVEGTNVTVATDNQKYVSGSSARVLPPEASENFLAWKTEDGTLIHPGDKITVTKNTTLTAVYTNKPQTETITYHYNFTDKDGNYNDAIFEDGNHPKNTTATVKSLEGVNFKAPTGYEFLGWATTRDSNKIEYAAGDPVFVDANGDNNLYAVWQVKTYTVTWVNWDGTVLETDTDVEYNSDPRYDGKNPTRAADAEYTYTFAGWTPEIKTVTGDATYKATYTKEANTYTLTYDLDGGEWENDTTYMYTKKYNEEVEVKADPTKEGYTFADWTSEEVEVVNGKFTMPAKNVTLKAKWNINKYTIKWVNWDGSEVRTDTEVPYGTELEVPEDPTRAADDQYTYTFKGWTPEVETVTGDAVYTAVYDKTVNKYTIKWVNWDGSEVRTDTEVPYGTELEVPEDPTREADAEYTYTFASWTPEIETVIGDATYKATYTKEANTYTLTYDLDGGEWENDTTYTYPKKYNEEVEVKADPTKEGYTFAGWMSAEVKVENGKFTMPAKNVTLKAKWNINKYTVTWVNWDNKELEKDKDVPYGATPKYNGKEPTKAGNAQYSYKFTGWDPEISKVTGDVTYKAQFEAVTNKYTVTWVNWDNKELEKDEDVLYGAMPKYDGKEPTKAGNAQYSYKFTGWNPAVSPVTGDVTYKAQFEAVTNTYTVTYDLNGGEWTETTNEFPYEYKATVEVVKTVPTREGYKFSGWRSEEVAIENNAFTMPAKDVVLKAVWEAKPTPTPIPSEEPTPTPAPTEEPTPTPAPTEEPTPTPAPTEEPTPTPAPTEEPTPTPAPTEEPTPTPAPTEEPTPTPAPTEEPTPTPAPTEEPTPTPAPTEEPTPTSAPTEEPTPTPAPNPNPNPATPTPTPVAPVVPATVATPTPKPTATPSATPSDNGGKGDGNNDGEIGETINDNDTPLANGEDIADNATPLAGLGTGAWALINLILTIVTTLLSILLLIGYIGKKKKALEDEDGNVVLDENGKEVMEYEKNKKGLWRLISIIPALIAIIVFIFTEDMTLPMIFVDKWTILHAVIALVQVVVMVLCKKKKDENDEDENAANA